jgi:hypothetical protein
MAVGIGPCADTAIYGYRLLIINAADLSFTAAGATAEISE